MQKFYTTFNCVELNYVFVSYINIFSSFHYLMLSLSRMQDYLKTIENNMESKHCKNKVIFILYLNKNEWMHIYESMNIYQCHYSYDTLQGTALSVKN